MTTTASAAGRQAAAAREELLRLSRQLPPHALRRARAPLLASTQGHLLRIATQLQAAAATLAASPALKYAMPAPQTEPRVRDRPLADPTADPVALPDFSAFDPEEVRLGFRVEHEEGFDTDDQIALRVALRLQQNPRHYSELRSPAPRVRYALGDDDPQATDQGGPTAPEPEPQPRSPRGLKPELPRLPQQPTPRPKPAPAHDHARALAEHGIHLGTDHGWHVSTVFHVAGQEYQFDAEHGFGGWHVRFGAVTPTNRLSFDLPQGQGDRHALEVFAKVGRSLTHLIRRHSPSAITFTAGAGEPSRVRLYDRFARQIEELTGYRLRKRYDDDSDSFAYRFTRPWRLALGGRLGPVSWRGQQLRRQGEGASRYTAHDEPPAEAPPATPTPPHLAERGITVTRSNRNGLAARFPLGGHQFLFSASPKKLPTGEHTHHVLTFAREAPEDRWNEYGLPAEKNSVLGNATPQLFSHLMALAVHFVRTHKPTRFEFSADSGEPSRVRLYDRLARDIARLTGYDLGTEANRFGDTYFRFSAPPDRQDLGPVTWRGQQLRRHSWAEVARYGAEGGEAPGLTVARFEDRSPTLGRRLVGWVVASPGGVFLQPAPAERPDPGAGHEPDYARGETLRRWQEDVTRGKWVALARILDYDRAPDQSVADFLRGCPDDQSLRRRRWLITLHDSPGDAGMTGPLPRPVTWHPHGKDIRPRWPRRSRPGH